MKYKVKQNLFKWKGDSIQYKTQKPQKNKIFILILIGKRK